MRACIRSENFKENESYSFTYLLIVNYFPPSKKNLTNSPPNSATWNVSHVTAMYVVRSECWEVIICTSTICVRYGRYTTFFFNCHKCWPTKTLSSPDIAEEKVVCMLVGVYIGSEA